VEGSRITTYWYDEGKILAEYYSTGAALRFLYDLDGLTGICYTDHNHYKDTEDENRLAYTVIKDLQGSIRKIIKREAYNDFFNLTQSNCHPERPIGLLAEYNYNAFGEMTITFYNEDGTVNHNPPSNHIAFLNPFRWKGHYYDIATKLYYIETSNGYRYYDPALGIFLMLLDLKQSSLMQPYLVV
jgi:RHS repeat-associated protein